MDTYIINKFTIKNHTYITDYSTLKINQNIKFIDTTLTTVIDGGITKINKNMIVNQNINTPESVSENIKKILTNNVLNQTTAIKNYISLNYNNLHDLIMNNYTLEDGYNNILNEIKRDIKSNTNIANITNIIDQIFNDLINTSPVENITEIYVKDSSDTLHIIDPSQYHILLNTKLPHKKSNIHRLKLNRPKQTTQTSQVW